MDAERVADLAYRSTTDAFRDMARRLPSGVVHDEEGIVLWTGSSSFPVLVNGVARVEPGLSGAEVIDRARSFFTPRGRGFELVGLEGRDEDVVAAAEAVGMVPIGEPNPLMVTDVCPESVALPAGVRIETVTSPADVAAAAEVNADAYAVYGMPAEVALSTITPSAVLQNHVAAVLAYDDEGPVATAQAVATHGVAYLFWVGTRQRAFGRGIGAAVTQAVTVAGFELGASLATLFASPMGAPVYRRLGWETVGALVNRVAFGPLG